MKLFKMTTPLNTESIKAIFFDLDNTLITTRKGDSEACEMMKNALVEKFDFDLHCAMTTVDTFLAKFRQCPHNTKVSLDEWRLSLWVDALPETCSHLAGLIYEDWVKFRYECLKPSKSVISLLKKLREHYTLVLVTNGTSEHQWEKINMLKMGKYFDCILVSGDLPWEKPNPCIFYEACKRISVQPSQCIMIGDKIETDILGGIQANLAATILLTQSKKKLSGNSCSHHVISDVLELTQLLPQHSSNLMYNKISADLVDESSCSSNASR